MTQYIKVANMDFEYGDVFKSASALCAKCSKAMEDDRKNAESICVKCQKALTKEKRINMSEKIINRIDKLLVEMSVVGGSYIGGTTVNVIGSGQTRAVGDYGQSITIMQQKEPDNKLAVKFNKILGAFVPRAHDMSDNPEVGTEQPDPGDFDDEYIK
jgi:hypothetical protein